MNCKNHPEKEAQARCTGCQEAFCPECLIEINGLPYCGSCKVMAADENGPTYEEHEMLPCSEATSALTFAIIGIFCLGIILGPVAVIKANKAKKMMDEDPRLSGRGKATAAQVIGWSVIALWLLGMIARFSAMASM